MIETKFKVKSLCINPHPLLYLQYQNMMKAAILLIGRPNYDYTPNLQKLGTEMIKLSTESFVHILSFCVGDSYQ